jgi:AcrR family transcriptional regulator
MLVAMADHLLREGLNAASLRPLAAAAGTSDRMLLYYFADKEELLTAILVEVAQRMQPLLEAAIAPVPLSPSDLRAEIAAVVRGAELRPFMQIWLEIAAAAGRGRQPYLAVAGRIADGFLQWIESRLQGPPGPDRKAMAAYLLVLAEGATVLDAIGRAEVAAASGPPHEC